MGGHLMSGPRENLARAVKNLQPGIPDTDFEYIFWIGLELVQRRERHAGHLDRRR